jgi:hypothetical protein
VNNMNKTMLGACLSLLMIGALLPLGAQANAPACTTGAGSNIANADVLCTDVNGPGSIDIKEITGLGVAVCFTDSTFPVACSPIAAGGIFNSGGGAFFDWSAHVAAETGADVWAGSRSIDVWVDPDNTGNICIGVTTDTCGYSVTICADRNDNGNCSPGTDNYATHQVSSTNFMPALLGGSPCDPAKEDKNGGCNGQGTGSWNFCMEPDTFAAGSDFDDMVIFLGDFVGAQSTLIPDPVNGGSLFTQDFIGVGLDVGAFHVTVRENEVAGSSCGTHPTPVAFHEPRICESLVLDPEEPDVSWIADANCQADSDFGSPAPPNTFTPDLAGCAFNAAGLTLTYDCAFAGACKDNRVALGAAVVVGALAGDTASTTLNCGNTATASAAGPAPATDLENFGTKTVAANGGPYNCVMTYTIASSDGYLAFAYCRDRLEV